MSDIRVPLDPIYNAFGVPAVVTRPDPNQTPITTTVCWVDAPTDDFGASDITRRARRKVLSVRRDQVPTLPMSTLVEAPEYRGGPIKTWRVEDLERIEDDQVRAVVIEETF